MPRHQQLYLILVRTQVECEMRSQAKVEALRGLCVSNEQHIQCSGRYIYLAFYVLYENEDGYDARHD